MVHKASCRERLPEGTSQLEHNLHPALQYSAEEVYASIPPTEPFADATFAVCSNEDAFATAAEGALADPADCWMDGLGVKPGAQRTQAKFTVSNKAVIFIVTAQTHYNELREHE